MAVPKSSGVKPAKAAPAKIANMYELVAGMDGNANTAKEFDEMPHDDDGEPLSNCLQVLSHDL